VPGQPPAAHWPIGNAVADCHALPSCGIAPDDNNQIDLNPGAGGYQHAVGRRIVAKSCVGPGCPVLIETADSAAVTSEHCATDPNACKPVASLLARVYRDRALATGPSPVHRQPARPGFCQVARAQFLRNCSSSVQAQTLCCAAARQSVRQKTRKTRPRNRAECQPRVPGKSIQCPAASTSAAATPTKRPAALSPARAGQGLTAALQASL